ncbi:cob(I)yrinic acid a,c-diamide adenosyltransferase [Nitrosophilus alvini]|uniref:cob(I)yrinic acid a,c-diamide adenosyltransferase n=1 Tax=Nitrosophilus alvini TaxID=2714855 RepID=UPI00190B9CA3|nr:cob(I)yrinic acid a,c-diamide adenosyltransferase [Nitrosophilus alvini]
MLQIYTGDGKGKTTAAVGLAVRALGNGLKVCFIQFMKGRPTGEIVSLKLLDDALGGGKIKILRNWDESFVKGEPTLKQKRMAKELFETAKEEIKGEYDLIVFDEVIVAMDFLLLDEEEVLEEVKKSSEKKEIILTGRGASPKLIEAADLVTEMRLVKHYFDKGVGARRGIEF